VNELLPHEQRLSRRRGEEGSALVEMALASAVFFALVFGIVQISFAFYIFNFVSDAAREATRWAIVRGSASCTNTPNLSACNATSTDIQNFVQQLNLPGSHASNLAVQVNWLQVGTTTKGATTWTQCPSACTNPGNAVQVQVSYPFRLAIPFWQSPALSLSSTSQMVISQ
jgi:Flp pilus assembly protein TadG